MTRKGGHVKAMSRRLLAAFVVLGLTLAAAGGAEAAMSKDEIKAAIEKEYGVTVLRMQETEEDGRPAYRVTMMNAGGDFNDAFQVNQIVVDAETGRPIPAFRHRASGYRGPEAQIEDTNRQRPDALRSGVWR